jgi:tetratricopeptide (TPR) repeat protein
MEFAQGEKIFDDLIAAGAELGESYYGKGLIRFGSGQLMDAEAFFEKCLKIHPSHTNALYYLGEIAERRHDAGAARQFYWKVLEINPNHAGAKRKIGPVSATDKETSPQPNNQQGLHNDLYDLLRRSEEPVEKEISRHLDEIASLIGTRNQRARALISAKGLSLVVLIAFACLAAGAIKTRSGLLGRQLLLFFLAVCVVVSFINIFLRAKTSKITCDRDWLLISWGIISKSVRNVHLFILSHRGVAVHQSLTNRITDDGTLQLQGCYLHGYFRRAELDILAAHFRQLNMLNPTSRNVLAALGKLSQIRSGPQ